MSSNTMSVVEAYLFFDGRCEEAIEFYRRALGAELLMLMRYKDSPEAPPMPVAGEKVMHASLRIGGSTVMVSDGDCTGRTQFQGFALTLSVPTEAAAEKSFAALGEGGQVRMPLSQTFFSPKFGMVVDRFGVLWMVIVPGQG